MVKLDVHRKQDKSKWLSSSSFINPIDVTSEVKKRSQSVISTNQPTSCEEPFVPLPRSPTFVRTEEQMLNALQKKYGSEYKTIDGT